MARGTMPAGRVLLFRPVPAATAARATRALTWQHCRVWPERRPQLGRCHEPGRVNPRCRSMFCPVCAIRAVARRLGRFRNLAIRLLRVVLEDRWQHKVGPRALRPA
jgi:hypothetical protein